MTSQDCLYLQRLNKESPNHDLIITAADELKGAAGKLPAGGID